jgi:hypothetical protein
MKIDTVEYMSPLKKSKFILMLRYVLIERPCLIRGFRYSILPLFSTTLSKSKLMRAVYWKRVDRIFRENESTDVERVGVGEK